MKGKGRFKSIRQLRWARLSLPVQQLRLSFHYLRPGLIGERKQVITAKEKFKIKLSILHGCKPWTKSHHKDTRKLNEEFF